jgi:hypothetical protein
VGGVREARPLVVSGRVEPLRRGAGVIGSAAGDPGEQAKRRGAAVQPVPKRRVEQTPDGGLAFVPEREKAADESGPVPGAKPRSYPRKEEERPEHDVEPAPDDDLVPEERDRTGRPSPVASFTERPPVETEPPGERGTGYGGAPTASTAGLSAMEAEQTDPLNETSIDCGKISGRGIFVIRIRNPDGFG